MGCGASVENAGDAYVMPPESPAVEADKKPFKLVEKKKKQKTQTRPLTASGLDLSLDEAGFDGLEAALDEAEMGRDLAWDDDDALELLMKSPPIEKGPARGTYSGSMDMLVSFHV